MRNTVFKKVILCVTIMAVFITFGYITPANAADTAEGIYYTCPMPSHADVAMEGPGKCPKCGMALVPKEIDGTKFVCPMKGDEDVISDKPGNCPKCGMRLVPKKTDADSQSKGTIMVK